jgi:UDP-glucose 4-epimerase
MTSDDTTDRATRPSEGGGSVLVTGGTGYVGGLALRALAAHGVEDLLSLDVRDPREPQDGVTYLTDDIRTERLPAILREHDVRAVVHLAAIVNPPPGMDEQTLHDIEVGGTEHVLAASLEAGVEHVTVTSSGAAYGYHLRNRGTWLTEDHPVRGSDEFAYSRHKAEVERMLARYRRVHPELGQLVLRPGTILGEGTDNQITALFELPIVLGLSDSDVPFVFIWDEDVAEIIARGVTERITGTYNVAGDGAVTMRDIARIDGKRYVRLPAGVLTTGLEALERLPMLPYGPEQVDFLRYRPVLANDRLKQAFPGLPRLTSRQVFDLYRSAR